MGFMGFFNRPGPAKSRIDLALSRSAPVDRQSGGFEYRTSARRPARAGADRVFFSVRSFAAAGRSHVLQHALVDDRGNVLISAFARYEGAVLAFACEPPEDLAVEPLEPEALEHMLTRLCGGCALVGFGRVLQGGLLPPGAVRGAAGVDCAWRRFMRVARRRGLGLDPRRPVGLGDALELAGLAPLRSEDAALRALAVRDLWAWMDAVE